MKSSMENTSSAVQSADEEPTVAIKVQPQTTFFDGSYRFPITGETARVVLGVDDAAGDNPPSFKAPNRRRGKGTTGQQSTNDAARFERSRTARSGADDDKNSGHFAIPNPTTRWRFKYNFALVLLDMAMMLLSYLLVLLIRPDIAGTTVHMMPNGIPITGLILTVTWVWALAGVQAYRRHTMGEGYRLYAKVLSAALVEFIILCSLGYLLRIDFARWLVVLAPIFACVFTAIERWLMRRLLHFNRRKGEYNYPTVLVGSPEGIRGTLEVLRNPMSMSVGYAPVAVCPIASIRAEYDPDAPQHLVSVPFDPQDEYERSLTVLSLNSRMPQAARHLGAQVVFITDVLTRDSETMRTLSLATESLGMEMALTARVADLSGGRLVLRNNSAMPILSATLPQYSLPTKIAKRAMDIVLSLIALIPSSLLMLGAAIAIKMEDGGPVFYKQERIGLYGKPFKCLKLRSMRVDADKMDAKLAAEQGVQHGITFKVKDDPRITKVGKVIRKTSIDELPQFINVLKGDMSLVGPRPQQRYEVEQYGSLYSTRLLVNPGITGPWQISGRSDLSPEDAEFLDVSYVENWSLMTDIAILIKTVAVVFKGDGAY